ncbi:hypothetical protein Psuf_030420 [Phytohabitans suffuscus]|uniref:Uncharacterized protein n=1 Tax=Phytohabitans suffuscus TaxID=624315 RepID=A0A6F8YI83_9ACTN|nr:hypothetical protein Psuf_030420 [Phytohabitans suffuscus]
MVSGETGDTRTESVLVRVSSEVYAALQLAQPFEGCRSMQELLHSMVQDHLEALRRREPGFEKALQGLREAQARADGVLAKRTAGSGRASRRRSAE